MFNIKMYNIPMDTENHTFFHDVHLKGIDKSQNSSARSIDGDSSSKNFITTDFYPKTDTRFQLIEDHTIMV